VRIFGAQFEGEATDSFKGGLALMDLERLTQKSQEALQAAQSRGALRAQGARRGASLARAAGAGGGPQR